MMKAEIMVFNGEKYCRYLDFKRYGGAENCKSLTARGVYTLKENKKEGKQKSSIGGHLV